MKALTPVVVVAFLLSVGFASAAQAQMAGAPDSAAANTPSATAPAAASAETERWSCLIAPYFLAPNMSGTTGLGGITSTVDTSPSDVFSHLQFGAMVFTQAQKGPWAVALDVLYMNLGEDGTTALGASEVDMKQLGVSLGIYRRVVPKLEIMAGAQLNSLSAGLKTSGPLAIDRSNDLTWVDPLVGGRVKVLETPKWGLSVTGNIGGFGVGSDFTWQVYPLVAYRASKSIEIGAAYRAMSIDYETGSGSTEFKYDLVTFGPEVGIGFHF